MQKANPWKSTRLLVLLPGTLFWIFFVIALTTKNPVVVVVTVVLGVGTAVGFSTMAIRRSASDKKLRRRVWADGQPATATVLKASTSGSLNNHPYVDLQLEVTGPDGATHVAQVRQLVSQLMTSRVQPGSELAVKVDRTDPAVVVLDPELSPYGY